MRGGHVNKPVCTVKYIPSPIKATYLECRLIFFTIAILSSLLYYLHILRPCRKNMVILSFYSAKLVQFK